MFGAASHIMILHTEAVVSATKAAMTGKRNTCIVLCSAHCLRRAHSPEAVLPNFEKQDRDPWHTWMLNSFVWAPSCKLADFNFRQLQQQSTAVNSDVLSIVFTCLDMSDDGNTQSNWHATEEHSETSYGSCKPGPPLYSRRLDRNHVLYANVTSCETFSRYSDCRVLLLQGALGMNNQPDDRVLAREIAQEICMADLIEFQRLTEQFEEIREWLLT